MDVIDVPTYTKHKARIVHFCNSCKGLIASGDEYYKFHRDRGTFCEKCKDEFVSILDTLSPRQ